MTAGTSVQLDFSLSAGEFTLSVHESLDVGILALSGPSGSGKTTLLEALAGWRTPGRGRIVVGGRRLFDKDAGIDLPVRERRIAYVPQDDLLFPHLTVRRNIAYGAAGGRLAATDEKAECLEVLDVGSLLDRNVAGLSGGERQRVALARALQMRPSLVLLDEPLAAVDPARRARILPYLRRVRERLAVPLIYVTHQTAEAEAVADGVLVLDAGRVTDSSLA